jgi:hypothetical protein
MRYAGAFIAGPVGRPQKPSVVTDEGPTALARRLGVSRQRADQLMNRDKHRAWIRVTQAVRNGAIIKPVRCDECRELKQLEAHHDDYSKPLVVKWVCPPCHSIIHPHHPYSRKPQSAEHKTQKIRQKLEQSRGHSKKFGAIQVKAASLGVEYQHVQGQSLCLLNERRCKLIAGHVFNRGRYAALRSVSLPADCEYLIVHIKKIATWMVIPRAYAPTVQTSFSIQKPDTMRRGANTDRHDWRDYVEAWHLLAKTQSAGS